MRDFTESYCERCGTRYTFGPTPSKRASLAGALVLVKGLKNFVMSDEASMNEAMAAARIDVERGQTARLAEEFHRTFNFCMTCRQYACDKCWNPNEGACLSCAPLSDDEPVAPEDHPIIRTTVAGRILDEIIPTRKTADAAVGGASAGAVPWPSEDPLPGRPEPRRTASQASEPTKSVPEVAQPAPAAAATQPPTPGPQPQIARSTAREWQTAQELREGPQSGKRRHDGATPWPTAEGAEEAELTPEKLVLVESRPIDPSPYEESDLQAEARSPSHTLDGDRARLAPHEPGRRTDPETPGRGVWEPEIPAPHTAVSSDLDVIVSPREQDESAEPPARAEPHRAPVIGRLLRNHTPIALPAQEQAPDAPDVLRVPMPAEASTPDSIRGAGPWPQATPWARRPTERRDRLADSDAAPLEVAEAASDAPVETVKAASEPAAEPRQVPFATPSPALSEPEPEPEPALAAKADEPASAAPMPEPAPVPATPGQLPLFTMPPATAERWPAIKGQVLSRPAVDRPANDPLQEKWAMPALPAKRHSSDPAPVVSQSAETPAPWPPIGASWPTQNAPAAPWPGPDSAFVPASIASTSQAELAETSLVAAIWAESAHEVLNHGGVRACHRCALPVSTHARFCRRCGTQQT